jgi:hypothetical protein
VEPAESYHVLGTSVMWAVYLIGIALRGAGVIV